MRERTYTTPREAMARAVATIRQHLPLIPGAKNWNGDLDRRLAEAESGGDADYLAIEWERAWAVDCRLYVKIGWGRIEMEERREVRVYEFTTEISTGGTGRSAADTIAFADLVGRVAQLACLLEAQQREPIADVDWKRCETCATREHPPGEPCDPLAVARAEVKRAQQALDSAEMKVVERTKDLRRAKREKAPEATQIAAGVADLERAAAEAAAALGRALEREAQADAAAREAAIADGTVEP